jgi:hypothetical protein
MNPSAFLGAGAGGTGRASLLVDGIGVLRKTNRPKTPSRPLTGRIQVHFADGGGMGICLTGKNDRPLSGGLKHVLGCQQPRRHHASGGIEGGQCIGLLRHVRERVGVVLYQQPD